MERFSSRSKRIGPKVHKNRRIYDKWGMQYHNLVQDVVFGKHCLPYTPSEPPPSLCEEVMESDPLYVCKHCKDCFRFKGSFEDHNARHSWILGFWCHVCFKTVCTHTTEPGSANGKCSTCSKESGDKRAYLRAKRPSGCNPKNPKLGAVKVFYNQCQFIEHLKMHRLSSVNIADLMLIPLPGNLSKWSTEFEIVCEAIMERAFVLRMHVVDWLKMLNLQNNWWILENGKSSNEVIARIVNNYHGRELFETYDKSTDIPMNSNSSIVRHGNKSSPDIEFIDNSVDKNTNNYSADIISDKNISETEDNPCIPNDITFVDCGPASQCLEPEIPVNYAQKNQVMPQNCPLTNTIRTNNKTNNDTLKNCNLLETDTINENVIAIQAGSNGSNKNLVIKPAVKDMQQHEAAQSYVKKTIETNLSKLITKTGVNKISNTPLKISIPFPAKKSTIIETNSESLQTSRLNSNSKVLIQGNIQNSKDIASIISQLPPHFISNKKVVVIGQDSCNIIGQSKNETTAKKDLISLVVDNSGTGSTVLTQKMCDTDIKKQEITTQIVIKDGKKYLIKCKDIPKDPKSSFDLLTVNNSTQNVTKQLTFEHNTLNPRLTSTNSNEIENIRAEQTTSLYNNIPLLTPSPSPSESTCSSCESNITKNIIMPKLQKVPSHLTSTSTGYLIQTPIQKFITETISLIKEDNGDLYMDIKDVERIPRESFREVCDVIIKHRREMFDELYQLNCLELKERLDHLQLVIEEMKQVLNFISQDVFNEKLRAVNLLKSILEDCFRRYDQDISQNQRNDDMMFNEWETEVNQAHKCPFCNKFIKPKSYIAGFSKLSKNDVTYCSCYKQVCHECLSHQGFISRFIAHQNFHKRKEPYICPDCCIKLDSSVSLEVHTWSVCFHITKKVVFTCRICDIDGFRDLESITRHFVVMHSKTKIGCENCFRVFSSYNEYTQHCTEVHSSKMKQDPIRLVICKLSNVILRCENYMLYLENYPGIRKVVWCKCPFCSLVTTDNKHVTTLLNSHIQNNHLESLSKVLSKQALEIYGREILHFGKKTLREFLSVVSENTFVNKTPDSTVMPKIVNTRTISSETFERGSETDMWSTNTDKVTENPQTMQKIDTTNKQLLPKINVRSIDDLKAKPKAITTLFSNETFELKKKSNSSSLQITVETEDGKMDLFGHKETEMKLDNRKEETAKTKESEKDNKLTMNALCESEESLLIDIVNAHEENSPIASNQKFANCTGDSQKVSNSTSEASTDNRIKIVDFRKICRPDIEPLFSSEMCDVQMKNNNIRFMVSIPEPPPLVRIPQHLLEPIKTSKPVNNSKKSEKNISNARRVTNKSKVRIALGTQNESSIDYLCHLCNELINTSQLVVKAHFREKHSDEYKVAEVTLQLSRMSPDFINGGYKQFINNKKRKPDSTLFSTKRKRRWTPKKHIELKDMNPPVGLCVEQETAEDGEGNFICKKCGQRCTDMSDLREHIATNHRLKGRYLICLECGDNFVVVPSLQMHLKAFHGIEDPINYMNENPSYAPNIDGDLQMEGRTTVANQCYVCMAVFEDKATVDKHLRVHGMAFLNRKRIEARNALEKKINTEEDKPSISKDGSKEAEKSADKPAETILEKINAAI
ncbi:uncharacterized protein LOC105836060 isoform X2 [Monomorium pharaonis]|uniref:uncharacterized protein LOC105836060 isoform X1 n=1 Tax=Monomorium pharaonis TaxID=307658 RepID=UPI001745FF42|nr:uncharacterized protein LOC105836060 isoform X1 [Monomorium pharaonis]XP_012535283.2 uncharacterized protein LOC105836060 isoform X1 [Monomorium pharaonis]XP_012535284.2 uncharacterized protein LOC105836060 isoform X2 [Monomorium pharaonis]